MPRPPTQRLTIRDIAQRAGVSESAVSLALNDRPGVSPATRERIRRLADQLGWRPSVAARALAGEGSATVGLVFARSISPLGVSSFFLQLMVGIQEALSHRGFGLLFQVVDGPDAECAAYRRMWAEHRVDGVLVVDPRLDDPRFEVLAELGLPAVVIGALTRSTNETEAESESDGGRLRVSQVWADDARAMAEIVDHLHELGHRRIVHIAGPAELAHTQRRVQSLRHEAERLGLVDARSIITDYSEDEGVAATVSVLAERVRPTAIVYDSDVQAVAALGAAAERRLSVPDDLSVVAWDDSVLCRSTRPRLAALVRDTVGFGRRAAEELLDLLDGGPAVTTEFDRPHLVPRGSIGPAPA
ncbi:LacI family DNA-binding transcriptional regulator [Streptacidiphilus fuscans]|uniref:LacI family DNA-binding transcriptional regulator n=1 Tax=Streptacidiphilus fuscans TaxID=2789292 RepID=A0A931B241_9ACTN|nr:LacI family DNA-binding transcriptional regulator [Streptacidiphilus fuscans]MBF9066608.1 LacI family DNA-binding transcriptional regulator [Streptacidiphilus fuscans]